MGSRPTPTLLWRIGGAVTVLALVATGWFALIGPTYQERSATDQRVALAEERAGTLRQRLVDLRAQQGQLETYLDELRVDRMALPEAQGMADFLRQLRSSAAQAGVEVVGLIVGAATQVTAAGTTVESLPVALTIDGETSRLVAFLDQLQAVGPRAVLVSSASAVPKDESGSLAGVITLTLTMRAFTG